MSNGDSGGGGRGGGMDGGGAGGGEGGGGDGCVGSSDGGNDGGGKRYCSAKPLHEGSNSWMMPCRCHASRTRRSCTYG